MLKIGEKVKWRNKGMNKQQPPDSGIHDTSTNFPCVHQVSTFDECWKLERKIKGRISSSSLIPVYMIHLPTAHVCTKFQSSRPHSSREKCDENSNVWKVNWTWRFHNMSIGNLRNSEVTDPIRPEFELTWDVIPVLVTSKFDEDPLKNEWASLETPFSH